MRSMSRPGARRISNIFNKTDAFDKCLWVPEVLAASAHALGEIKVHGANMRDPERDTAIRTCTLTCQRSLPMIGGS